MRVFVAVDIGDAVRREAARVVSALQMKLEAAKTPPKVVWVKPAALHVTIRFLGEVKPDEVERIKPLLADPDYTPGAFHPAANALKPPASPSARPRTIATRNSLPSSTAHPHPATSKSPQNASTDSW